MEPVKKYQDRRKIHCDGPEKHRYSQYNAGKESSSVKSVLLAITRARAGSASVVDAKGRLVGIFTDGDLRRHLGVDALLPLRQVREVMTRNPITISKEMLAGDAFRILRERKIDEIPVVDNKRRPIGLVDVQDLLKAGLV